MACCVGWCTWKSVQPLDDSWRVEIEAKLHCDFIKSLNGSGVGKEGSPAVAGGSRLTLKSFLIWAPCVVRFGGWLPAGLDLSFLHSTQPASYLVGIKTRGEKNERVVGVLGWQMMMRMILCHTTHAMLCCAGRNYLLFLFW